VIAATAWLKPSSRLRAPIIRAASRACRFSTGSMTKSFIFSCDRLVRLWLEALRDPELLQHAKIDFALGVQRHDQMRPACGNGSLAHERAAERDHM